MRKCKRLFAALIAATLLLGAVPAYAADTTPTFTDVKPGDAHYEAITAAVKAGIINGYDDNTFGPNDPMTHRQLKAIVNRVRGVTDIEFSTGCETWENKIVDRGAAAYAMWNYLRDSASLTPDNISRVLGNTSLTNLEAKLAGDTYAKVSTVNDFADTATINAWVKEYRSEYATTSVNASKPEQTFQKAICNAYNWDLTKWLVGADMKFDPYATITRGELCQCLYNAGIVGLAPVGTAPYSIPVTGVTPVAPVTPTEPEEPVAPVTVAGFTDVMSDDYFADAVSWAVDNGVTSGTSKTTFSPYASVTRAQAVTFMWRAAGYPEPAGKTSPFTDVTDTSAYYYKPILWAAEKGITSGVSKTLFGVNSPVAYDQMFAFLARFAGVNTGGSGDWSANAISWANSAGLTDGLTFNAKAACPRCDVVYALWKQLG